ncbi:MAG TPA: hypothetical protein VH022_14420 [Candidatus Acidoferrum sp.]|jgi:hypothetical protein|nr:hypothetical protein [Candidatus Acidoferrum sp.]
MAEAALKRRIVPTFSVRLEMENSDGTKFSRSFQVSFDMNVAARIEERTGINLLGLEIWNKLNVSVLSIFFWSAILPNHPEYDTRDAAGNRTDEGLETLRENLNEENANKVADACWQAYLSFVPKDKRELLIQLRKEAEAGKKSANPPPPAEDKPEQVSAGESSTPSRDLISESPSKSSES